MPPENNPPAPGEPQAPSSPLKQIRTFQGDVADALGRQKESLVSIHQTEALKQRSQSSFVEEEEISRRRKNFFFLMVGSLFFIILGLVGAWYGYSQYQQITAPPVIVKPTNQFISPQSTVNLNVASSSRESLITGFDEAISGLSDGELRQVLVKSGELKESPLITSSQFFSLLEARAPGSLVRSFDPLFMLGAIGLPDQSLGSSRFLIIKLSSFEQAFPGMLAWEANMVEDIGPLFSTRELMKAIDPASVFFQDVISENEDVRVLELPDASGVATSTRPVLLYSFLDNEMLIITENLPTLKKLIDRLIQEKLSR